MGIPHRHTAPAGPATQVEPDSCILEPSSRVAQDRQRPTQRTHLQQLRSLHSHWMSRNRPLPSDLVANLRGYTKGKIVLDIGCGPSEQHFVDFRSAFVFRYDVGGFYGLPSTVGLKDFFKCIKYAKAKAVVVASRSVSVMPIDEFIELSDLINNNKGSISKVIICDYTPSPNEDYILINHPLLGAVHSQQPRWSDHPFNHYSIEQMALAFRFKATSIQKVELPGIQHDLAGVIWVGSANT